MAPTLEGGLAIALKPVAGLGLLIFSLKTPRLSHAVLIPKDVTGLLF